MDNLAHQIETAGNALRHLSSAQPHLDTLVALDPAQAPLQLRFTEVLHSLQSAIERWQKARQANYERNSCAPRATIICPRNHASMRLALQFDNIYASPHIASSILAVARNLLGATPDEPLVSTCDTPIEVRNSHGDVVYTIASIL